jgi:hypothetical protein
MGACNDVNMNNNAGQQVVTGGSGTWESGKDELTLTRGTFGEIEVDGVYKVTSAGGTSPPPKGDYTCLESSSSKKRFRNS